MNTKVGYHFLLQGIFPTQELNPGLLHCRHFTVCMFYFLINGVTKKKKY